MFSVILGWGFLLVLTVLIVAAVAAWELEHRWAAGAIVAFTVLLVVAVAAPGFRKARPTAQLNSCIANLKYLTEAKSRWVAESKPEATTLAQPSDLAPFLKQGLLPACPTGGTYTLGTVNEPPRCSHADKGHALTSSR